MPDNKNLLNFDDLADVFAQLNDIEDAQKNLLRKRKPPSADMKRLSRNIRIIINYNQVELLHNNST